MEPAILDQPLNGEEAGNSEGATTLGSQVPRSHFSLSGVTLGGRRLVKLEELQGSVGGRANYLLECVANVAVARSEWWGFARFRGLSCGSRGHSVQRGGDCHRELDDAGKTLVSRPRESLARLASMTPTETNHQSGSSLPYNETPISTHFEAVVYCAATGQAVAASAPSAAHERAVEQTDAVAARLTQEPQESKRRPPVAGGRGTHVDG